MVQAVELRPDTSDVVTNDVPEYVRESYPYFVQFVKGYYEWLEKDGNAYERIKNHLSYLNFDQSLDLYIDALESEYLTSIPKDAISDPEFFIEWSKKFNLAKGSKESYQFLFKLLFGEQTTDIYLPKDNILRTSDGEWVSGQSVMLISNNGHPEDFLYKEITQTREIFSGFFDTASATVDSYSIIYQGEFIVVQLVLTNVVGTFLKGYPIVDKDGNTAWPIPAISSFVISDPGTNFAVNTPLELDSSSFDGAYTEVLTVEEEGKLDTRLTMIPRKDSIQVIINGETIAQTRYEFDGQILTGSIFLSGLSVTLKFSNAFGGKYFVSTIDKTGGVVSIDVSETSIAISNTTTPISFTSTLASGLEASGVTGVVRALPGYYIGNKGQLSTDMYLEDSNYYQEYSYVIKTEQDIQKYAEIVKNVLHPAGFKMFGIVEIFNILQDIIHLPDNASIINVQGQVIAIYDNAIYSLGNNYLFLAKTHGGFMSPRVYKGNEWSQSYLNANSGYALQDESKEREYDEQGNVVDVQVRGWMTHQLLSDSDVQQPEDYFEKNDWKSYYMETGYVETVGMDTAAFLAKYVNVYVAIDYVDDGYVSP